MAWTAPRTWAAGEIVTAAMLNTHVRDNFLETAPAKVLATWDLPGGAGANALTRIPWPGASVTGILASWSAGLGWATTNAVALPYVLGGGSGIGYLGMGLANSVLASNGSAPYFVTPSANFQDLAVLAGALGFTPRSLYQAADQTTSGVGLVNNPYLQWTVQTGEAWHFDAYLWIQASDQGFRFQIAIGGSAAGNLLGGFCNTPIDGVLQSGSAFTNSINSVRATGTLSTSSILLVFRGFLYLTSGGPVTAVLQWAQNAAVGSTTIKAGSAMRIQRVG